MSDVQFNEENEFYLRSQSIRDEKKYPAMVKFLIRTKLFRNERLAMAFLVLIMIFSFGATWWLMVGKDLGEKYVITPDGTKYTGEEYIDLLSQGIDPLNPEDAERAKQILNKNNSSK